MGKHYHPQSHPQKSTVVVEGRFLGFVTGDSCKLKYLRLATTEGEITFKMVKELRSLLWQSLVPGVEVRVIGTQKQREPGENFKLKAYEVVALGAQNRDLESIVSPEATLPSSASSTLLPPKQTILVCQKADCCKRGGKAVTEALQAALGDRQLTEYVAIKGTGCMKRCKDGPNIVMPDKTRYSGIRPNEIAPLLERHLHSQH